MMQGPLKLSFGLAILPLYFVITILIGWAARRRGASANEFLNASRSLPLWVVVAAYLAANCGALEIVGLSAMAAQYGVQAFHFYWVGAIPAMVFLAIWMMPVYRRSGVRSVPEYLEVRYGPKVRLLNACVLAVAMLLLAGISLYAMGQVLEVVVGLSFGVSITLSSAVVLAYVLLGGVKATIYNEVFQLAVMLAGLAPLAVQNFHAGLLARGESGGAASHLWTGIPVASMHAPMDRIGVVLGLGLVLSFGYWCTDFVLMQRAFTARTESEARQVPLWAGFGKLVFAFIVVVPGLAAHRMFPGLGISQRFDQALPALMMRSYGPWMLGLGLTALAASLMSGLAANVSAFAAIWTEDIYAVCLRPKQTDAHYLRMGRISSVVAVAVSVLASYVNFLFRDLMEHVQLIFSVFGAPFFAIFLLGMATRRTTARGAVAGFLSGTAVAVLHLTASTRGWLVYGSVMNANFHVAMYGFATAATVGWFASGDSHKATPAGLEFAWRAQWKQGGQKLLWTLSAILLAACVLLNVVWR